MLLANFTDRTLELTRMKRIVRACVAGLCLVTVSLAITGALYETIGSRHDAQRSLGVATLSRLGRSA